jgi:putative ABC transport system substrate-binding protein
MNPKRRQFITLLGGAAAAWPMAAWAEQQADQMRRVGLLMGGGVDSPSGQPWATAFQEELARLGWSEGRNVAVYVRWGQARNERYAEIAAEFVRLKMDVIVTTATPSTLAAMQATSTIPIVFTSAGDPVSTGLVASLSRPGGNVTGTSNQTRDIAGKRVALLRELVPALRRLAILVNANNVSAMLEAQGVEAAARALGLEVVTLEIGRSEDVAPALDTLKEPSFALYLVIDPLLDANRIRINTLALSERLPTMFGSRDAVEIGGLMSYGANIADLYRRSANYADKILRGAAVGDLPVEQPTKFDLVINLTTAKALGLTVPASLLATADEVIE